MTDLHGADIPEEETIRVRRTASGEGEPETEALDGSTVIARRESRRRAARPDRPASASRPAPPDAAPGGRVAAAPDAASRAVYGARTAHPVVITRAVPPERIPQAPIDGAAAAAAQRHRTRRTALIVVIAASAVAVGAAASLVAVVLSP